MFRRVEGDVIADFVPQQALDILRGQRKGVRPDDGQPMNAMHKIFHPTLSEGSTDPQEALDILCGQRDGTHPDDGQPIECGTRQQAECTLSKF